MEAMNNLRTYQKIRQFYMEDLRFPPYALSTFVYRKIMPQRSRQRNSPWRFYEMQTGRWVGPLGAALGRMTKGPSVSKGAGC